jgi:glycosyltransferase involved in cell wall biosynthesis
MTDPPVHSPPTFSVVIAAYNAERTLPATMRSVLTQTRADFELIVVDDGSTDGTADTAGHPSDQRLLYMRQQNLGPAAARNAGIERATGTFVSLLDSDDLWLPNYLETMAAAFDASPGADLAFTDAWRLDDTTRRIHRRTIMSQQHPPAHPPAEAQQLLAALLERNFVYTSATVRRDALTRAGGFKTLTRSEDYELWLRLAAQGSRFVNTRKILAVYRDRPGSRIHSPVAMLQGRKEIYEHVLSSYELSPPVRAVAERRLAETTQRLRAETALPAARRNGTALERIVHDIRVYRRSPPAPVRAAFDVTAV